MKIIGIQDVVFLSITEITTIDIRECKNQMKLKDKATEVY